MESETQKSIPFYPLHQPAEEVLTRRFGRSISIAEGTLLTDPERRNRLWRCTLQEPMEGIPETFILKQVSPDGYDPTNLNSHDTDRFFNDWAGAQFISEVAPDEKHGPVFYGGNVALGFIVLEDLGEHHSLVTPLLEGDAASASTALVAFARRLGAMHASAMGKEATYQEIRRSLDPDWAMTYLPNVDALRETHEKQVTAFSEICAEIGVEPSTSALEELRAALLRVDAPVAFRTFLHCDPCPDNDFYVPPDLRLIDFEFSSFGHALRDGLYGRLPFPTCWCANAIPGDVVQKMEEAYRAELADVCPEIKEDALFLQEAAAVSAYWMLGSLRWHLKGALEEDQKWGIAGTRARVLTRLQTLLDTARSADQMYALCETAAALQAELQQRWPDATPLPLYPAFR